MLCIVTALFVQEIVAVDFDSPMRYRANAVDPGIGLAWVEPLFDDSGWDEGQYAVGYNAGGMIRTDVPDGTSSVYTRVEFQVADPAAVTNVFLGVDYDDGYAAWINGVEVARAGFGAGDIEWDTRPPDHESSNGSTPDYAPYRDITAAASGALVAGPNVLAIGVWNDSTTSSDLALAPRLSFNRPPGPPELTGELAEDTTLGIAGSPYLLGDLTVPAGVTLTVDPGVEIRGRSGAALRVEGALRAIGTESEHIVFTRDGSSGRWDGITIDLGDRVDAADCTLKYAEIWWADDALMVEDAGEAAILLEDCAFDCWGGIAVEWDSAPGLVIRRCEFGLRTPEAEAHHEMVHGYYSGALIEFSTFGRNYGYNDVIDLHSCTVDYGSVPVIRYNTFFGGEDDAIDLDECDGWIIGNLVMDRQPPAGAPGSANGGGITGNEGSRTVVMHNICYNCYHGIGYKNGSDVLIANNTIIDCHVGITVYRQNCSERNAHAKIYNNIVWGVGRDDEERLLSIVTDAHWWPPYCQEDFPHGSVEVYNSIIEGGWEGENVIDADPMLVDPAGGDFTPGFGSPAIDASYGGAISGLWADPAELAEALLLDHTGLARLDVPCVDDASGSFLDIGAVEFRDIAACGGAFFVRGDANDDGRIDISDGIAILRHLFAGRPTDCLDANDVNDDGDVGIADAIYLLTYLFANGPIMPPPYPAVGLDSTEDDLTCERSGAR